MPLFLPRVIEKKLRVAGNVPAVHAAILDAWAKSLAAGVYDSETQNDAEFIQRILIDVLGYAGSSAGHRWTVAKNQPIGSGNVDAALGDFSADHAPKILAPFELKGAKTKDLDAIMPGRNKSPVQQAWEYAMDAKGAQWVLVSNYREIRLYAVGYGRKDYELFNLSTLNEPHNYHRFILVLSAGNLLSGNTRKLLEESDAAEKEITAKLYTEYKATRSHLIDEIIASNKKMPPLHAVQLAQTILDRVLFVAFAEDKGLLKKDTLKGAYETKNLYSPQPAWDNFKGLFQAIDKGNDRLNIPGYNGGLFADTAEINALQISDETCKLFADIGSYDYDSEISVNILGHIFEQSISDLEEINKSLDPESVPLEEVGSKRRTDGIFYTPPFVTRQIVEQAIGKWLADRKSELGFHKLQPLSDADYASIKVTKSGKRKNQVTFNANVARHVAFWEAYRDRLSSIKVVDPACGSGAFLNEVFDYLYREGQGINRELETLYGGQISLFRWDTHILANNIFGVDINRESVEITKLSLWLKTANQNEKLSYLDDNIKVGNSLISDRTIAGDLAFDWTAEFKSIMEAGRFDVVVGNPPYVDSEAMTKACPREREFITRTYEQAKGNWDLYVAFIELGCNLLADDGYLSFITPDKWISKDFGIEIRKRVFPGLLSILPLGRGVFESVLVDSIITTTSSKPQKTLAILSRDHGEATISAEIDKTELRGNEGFDQFLSPDYPLLRKLESASRKRLSDLAEAESACATSDTYTLGEILKDAKSLHGYDATKSYKVVNTGTLSRFGNRWGSRPMRYLKKDYAFPIVSKKEFMSHLGATYQRRAASPKLIIKGLTLLDGALDLDGSFVPAKSTIVICHKDQKTLKLIAGILNSQVASFYVKRKYASASYNGGVNFTPDMLNSVPVPETLDQSSIVKNVDKILKSQSEIRAVTDKVHSMIRASAGPGKLRKALEDWFELSKDKFLDEIGRQGIKLSVRTRADWAEIFDEHRAKIARSVTELKSANDAIDSILIRSFALNAEEQERLVPN